MATPYTPPEWGEKGMNAFGIYLDVIKGGSLVETLSLPLDESKSFVVAGRMEPLCDLVLQHPSISRVHAVLQFDPNGALFVKDLKSSHGTFVNKKRLNTMEFQRLHVGDLLVFGESTRKYAVCGPEELMPEEPDREKLRERIEAKKKAEQRRKEEEASGASWGFREDAEEEEDDGSSSEDEASKSKKGGHDDEDLPEYLRGIKEHGRSAYETSVKATDVSEKDQKLFTQLQNRIAKMENLQVENERILAKQNDLQGLSEGQEKTLERNSERIKSLRKEIEDLEDRIHARNAQREQTKASNVSSKTKSRGSRRDEDMYGYDSDEDDFYDRTSANQRKLQERQAAPQPAKTVAKAKTAATGEVLTAEIIQRKIKMLESNLAEVETEHAHVAADTTDTSGGKDGEEVDALEAFMQSTAKELHAKELARLVTRREEIEKQLKQQRQLLAIAMPALQAESVVVPRPDPIASHKPSGPSVPVVSKATEEPVQSLEEKVRVVNERDHKAVDDVEAKPSEEQETKRNEATRTQPAEETETVKPKKRRLMGPTLPPPSSGPQKPMVTTKADAAVLEGGDRVWVPPANQTGDGRTSLNDKFGY